ncbi:MAG: protein TolR [Pseudomonadota bacterium]
MAGMTNGGLRRKNGRGGYRPMSEINVTPFVDVMLVLLIVFMVTAPLLTVGVPVDLPRTEAQNIPNQEEPLVVSVTDAGAIFVQETEVEMPNLVPLLIAITEANPEAQIYIRGDRGLLYGRIMEVMGAINSAGFERVSLVAELPQEPAQ